MAIYHLSVKPVSRSGGRSATAAAAYRSGELIQDLSSGEVFDYSRKRGVEHTEIVLSTEAARQDINWARDRQALWNAAEAAENRSNSRVAREYELALPHELSKDQRVDLVRAFAKEIADRYQVAVDFAIHQPHRSGDERNHHAHVLTTTRVIEPQGLGEKAEIEWSDTNRRKAELVPGKEEIALIRERWAALTNEHLKEQQLEIRIDHRSLEAQGIEREATSHLGPAVSGMERRGIETEVGRRIAWEMAAAAQERLAQAAELGKLEQQQSLVQQSILDLSGDLTAARAQRQENLEQRAGEAATRAPRRLIEQLKEHGPELRAYEPSHTVSSAENDMSAPGNQDRLAAQLDQAPAPQAIPPPQITPALDLSAIKAAGREAALRWAAELAQQKLNEQQRLKEQHEQDLKLSRGRGQEDDYGQEL